MSKPSKKATNGLMALSSVAVLAVYSAGYAKTDSAAQRIAARSARHQTPIAESTPNSSAPAAPATPEPQQIATLNPLHSATPLPDATPATQPTNTPGPLPAAAPVQSANLDSNQSFVAPGNSAPPAAAPTPAPAQPEKPKVDYYGVLTANLYDKKDTPVSAKWKNGTFYGWGSCPHGDIQAAVVIQDGQIDSTFIAQCLTRYSCDVISKLPDMAARRQSSKLDAVSGATESAEAFMDALDDALLKAKNPNYQAPASQSK